MSEPYYELLHDCKSEETAYFEEHRKNGNSETSRLYWFETNPYEHAQKLVARVSNRRRATDPLPSKNDKEVWGKPKKITAGNIVIFYRTIAVDPEHPSQTITELHWTIVNRATSQERINEIRNALPTAFDDEYRERTLRKLLGPQQVHVASTGRVTRKGP